MSNLGALSTIQPFGPLPFYIPSGGTYSLDVAIPTRGLLPSNIGSFIPTLWMTENGFYARLTSKYPDQFGSVKEHALRHISIPITAWKRGDPLSLLFHRAYTSISVEGIIPEQSEAGLEIVFKIGGANVEVDTTGLNGATLGSTDVNELQRGAKNTVMIHVFDLFRQYMDPGLTTDANYEKIKKLRTSYGIIDERGSYTSERFYTDQAPMDLLEYTENIMLCYPKATTIHDTRSKHPRDAIMQMLAMVQSSHFSGVDNGFLKRNIFQIYGYGFPLGGSELAQELQTEADRLGITLDTKSIHVIPVVTADLLERLVPAEEDRRSPEILEAAAIRYLASFNEPFKVVAYHVSAQMLDKYTRPGTYVPDREAISNDFQGDLDQENLGYFIRDKVCHVVAEEMHKQHGLPIIGTNKAATTSSGDNLYQHWFPDHDLKRLKPDSNAAHFAFVQQSLISTALANKNFHMILTDFPEEILIQLAYNSLSLSMPVSSFKPRVSLCSQEELRRLVSRTNRLGT
jgi:hypothetical protein